MRIALILQRFNEIGGIGEVVENLSRTFSQTGHQVLIASTCTGSTPGYERRVDSDWTLRHISIQRHESPTGRYLTFLPDLVRLTRILNDWRPDIISSHVYDWSLLPLIALTRNTVGVPVIHTFHDCAHQASEKAQRLALASLIRANALIAVSFAAKKRYCALIRTAERTTVITNGVEPATQSVAPFSRERPYIFCAARYNLRQKALDTLIDSFGEVAKENPEVDLLIAGWGPDHEQLQRQITSAGLAHRIELLGSRMGRSLRSLYKGALFFAMPSRWEEALGMGLLEAMAERRAVIATRIGGVPEVVRDGDNGLLVEVDDRDGLANALRTLVREDSLRRAMGDCGFRRVQTYHCWGDIARRYLDVFETSHT